MMPRLDLSLKVRGMLLGGLKVFRVGSLAACALCHAQQALLGDDQIRQHKKAPQAATCSS